MRNRQVCIIFTKMRGVNSRAVDGWCKVGIALIDHVFSQNYMFFADGNSGKRILKAEGVCAREGVLAEHVAGLTTESAVADLLLGGVQANDHVFSRSCITSS